MPRIDRAVFAVLLGLLLLGGAQAQGQQQGQDGDISINPQVAQPGGDLPGDPQIELELVADGLVDPVNVASTEDGRLFVVERIGRILVIDENGQMLDEPFLDIQGTVLTEFLEQGLLGLAFHPNFSENGRFYVNYTDYQTNGDQWIVEYQVSGDDENVADPESGRVLLTIEEPYVNHNGGTIRFGPDGYLYIGVGDGGYAADTYETAQDISDLLGSILRIDVDSQEGGFAYGIPDDNPFVPAGVRLRGSIESPPQYHPDARPEIWAYGLRNPWQFSFDQQTGDLYVADVGQNMWEEIHVVQSGGIEEGHNFGWDFMEGSHCYPSETAGEDMQGDDCLVGTLPVAEYNHEQGDCSITGMGVYRGDEFTELDGVYFTSDFCSGRVWGLAQGDDGAWQFEELLDTDLLVTGAGTSPAGDVYLTSCQCQFGRDYDPFANPSGQVWRVVAEGQAEGETAGGGAGQEGAGQGGEEEEAGADEADAEEGDAQEAGGEEGDTEQTDDGEADAQDTDAQDGQQEDEGPAIPDEDQQQEQQDGADAAPGDEQQQDEQQEDGAGAAPGDEQQQDEQQQDEQQQEQDSSDIEQDQVQTDDQGPEGNLQALITRGEEIYHQVASPPCGSCHGAEGQGAIGPALAGNDELQDAPFVINRILHGTEIMPAYAGQLSNEEIAALATYLRNGLEGNEFGPVTAQDVQEER